MPYLKSIRLENIGPFRDSGVIELSPKVSVIVGENGAGKTTLLETMSSLQCGRSIVRPTLNAAIGQSGSRSRLP